MRYIIAFCFTLCSLNFINAQDLIYQTFKDTRVINSQSIETLQKRKLDVRIGHRFGDMAGDNGGWSNFYGLENAADVFIGAEYGINNRLMIGLSRTKGSGPLKQLVNPFVKYRITQQKSEGTPVSITAYGLSTISTMAKSDQPESPNYFESFSHRMIYNLQLIIGRKFSDRFSLQVTPSWTHRNLVPFNESNDIVSIGLATRLQVNKMIAVLADLTVPLAEDYTTDNGYYVPFGLGLEFDTGGHVFQVNVTNARGTVATDYIPHTRSNWGDGQFRLGFTISRLFNL